MKVCYRNKAEAVLPLKNTPLPPRAPWLSSFYRWIKTEGVWSVWFADLAILCQSGISLCTEVLRSMKIEPHRVSRTGWGYVMFVLVRPVWSVESESEYSLAQTNGSFCCWFWWKSWLLIFHESFIQLPSSLLRWTVSSEVKKIHLKSALVTR